MRRPYGPYSEMRGWLQSTILAENEKTLGLEGVVGLENGEVRTG